MATARVREWFRVDSAGQRGSIETLPMKITLKRKATAARRKLKRSKRQFCLDSCDCYITRKLELNLPVITTKMKTNLKNKSFKREQWPTTTRNLLQGSSADSMDWEVSRFHGSLQLLTHKVLQLDCVSGKLSDALGQLLCCHGILIHHPAVRLLIEGDFLVSGRGGWQHKEEDTQD